MAPDEVITAEEPELFGALAADSRREDTGRARREPAPGGSPAGGCAATRPRSLFGGLFILLVLACVAAPLWAEHVAHTTPEENHLTDTIEKDGETVNVVGLDGVPIGPTWQGEFFLGADQLGRDNMVRLLYGGRNSLMIGVSAALVTTLLGVIFGVARRLLPRLDRQRDLALAWTSSGPSR